MLLFVWPVVIKSIYCTAWAKHGNCLTNNDNPNHWFLVMLLLCNILIQLIEDSTVTSIDLLHTIANKETSHTSYAIKYFSDCVG